MLGAAEHVQHVAASAGQTARRQEGDIARMRDPVEIGLEDRCQPAAPELVDTDMGLPLSLVGLQGRGDIGLIVSAIMAAVFFTLLLLTGNTMAQAVRERIPELATLKTMGFSDRSVLGLVFAEAVLLIVLGGVLGLGLVALIVPAVTAASGGMLQLPPVGAGTWAVGLAMMLVIGLLVGVLPALRAMRLKIVDALAGR